MNARKRRSWRLPRSGTLKQLPKRVRENWPPVLHLPWLQLHRRYRREATPLI
jgi:hypothetical protein